MPILKELIEQKRPEPSLRDLIAQKEEEMTFIEELTQPQTLTGPSVNIPDIEKNAKEVLRIAQEHNLGLDVVEENRDEINKQISEFDPNLFDGLGVLDELEATEKEKPSLLKRIGISFLRKTIIEPLIAVETKSRAISGMGILLETTTLAKEFREEAGREPTSEEYNELAKLGKAIYVNEVYRKYSFLNIAPPKTLGEKAAELGTGLASFLTQLAIAKKVLGAGGTGRDVMAWEMVNMAEGGPVGKGAVMRLAFAGINRVPAKTLVGKTLKTTAAGTTLASATAISGGSKEDVAVAFLIPFALKAIKATSAKAAKLTRGALEKRTIKQMRTFVGDRGYDLSKVPDDALREIINVAKKGNWWAKQYKKGKINEATLDKRLGQLQDRIKPIIVAIAKQQPEKDVMAKYQKRIADRIQQGGLTTAVDIRAMVAQGQAELDQVLSGKAPPAIPMEIPKLAPDIAKITPEAPSKPITPEIRPAEAIIPEKPPTVPAKAPTEFKMSPALQRLHDSPARSKGLDAVSESQAKSYFKQIRALAKKYERQDIVNLAEEGEEKYFGGDYAMAVQSTEGALGYLHQVETMEAKADAKEFERIQKLTEELAEEERKSAPTPAKVEKPAKAKAPIEQLGGLPEEAPGLTGAEAVHLGKREQTALRSGQRLGQKIGYKKGYQEAALTGRRKLNVLRMDVAISKKSKEDLRGVIQQFVPKDQQHRFMTRLSRVKDTKGVQKITGEIEKFIDDYEHRAAVRGFKKFVSETNKKYRRGEVKLGKLSESAREQIGKVFKEYDAVALSEEKAEDLQAHKEHIQKVAGSISRAFREWEGLDEQGLDVLQLPNRRIMDLDRLEKVPIKDLGTEDIQYIQDELQSLLTNESRKAQIRANIRSEHAHTYVTKAAGEVFDRGKTVKGAAKIPGVVRKFFGVSQANLRTLVRGATTKDAVATEEFLVDKIYESKRIADKVHREWFIYAQEQFDKIGLSESFVKDYYSDIKITLGGKEVTVPKHILLNLWLNAEADGNLKRLLTAREHQITVKGKTTYVSKITLEELQNAISQMPKEWKQIGETIFKINRQKNAPAINETSLWERGYPIAVYEKYFPFPRKMRNIPEGHRTEIQQAIENRGRYQRRTGGTLPHVIKDPMAEFLNGLQLDSQYHAMTLALQDAKTLLADNRWRSRMDRRGNKSIIDAIIKMYQRGEGLSSDRSVADILGGKFLTTMGKGTLSLRPTGAMIQTASLPAAYSVIDAKYFDALYTPTPAKVNTLMDKDATMWWRWKARHFDYVLGSTSAENAVNKFLTGKDKMKDAMLKHYTWGDQWAVLQIWNAAQNQVASTTDFVRNTEEFNEAASSLFHRAMETQPQWDIWHRSLFTSEPGAFERSFALFMSARNAQYNVLLQAQDDYRKGRIDKITYGNRVGDIVEANLRVAILRKVFRQVVKYGTLALLLGIGKRDEEDVKRYVKKDLSRQVKQLPTETVFNMVGLPVYSQVIATITDQAIAGFSGKWSKTKFGDVRTGSVLTDFLVDLGLIGWSTGKFGRDMALQTRYDSGKKIGRLRWKDSGVEVVNDMMEIISQLTGLPYSGPRSDIVWPAKVAAKGTTEDILYKETLAELNKLRKKAKQELIKELVEKGELPIEK